MLFRSRFQTGVDTRRFRPPLPGEKGALRRLWGLPEDARVVLHVGHLVPSRNLSVMAELTRLDGVLPVMLASRRREPGSAALEDRLRSAGVVIFTGYRPEVEQLYRLADCYLFPVTSPMGAIAMPLSVLEALASDLPVASTPFGVLPELFQSATGIRFASGAEGLVCAVEELLARPCSTREVALPFSWETAIGGILERAGIAGGSPGPTNDSLANRRPSAP